MNAGSSQAATSRLHALVRELRAADNENNGKRACSVLEDCLVAVGGQSLTAGGGTALVLQQLAQELLDLAAKGPPAEVFSEAGGAPREPPLDARKEAVLARHYACLLLRLLGSLVSLLHAADTNYFCLEGEQQASSAQPRSLTLAQVLIEELPPDPVTTDSDADRPDAPELLRKMLLLCALYCSSAQQLPSPWSDDSCAVAARELLGQLSTAARIAHPASAAAPSTTSGSGDRIVSPLSELPPAQKQEQDLLAACLPGALQAARSVLLNTGARKGDHVELEPYKGPGTFPRVLAARQLAWTVLQLHAATLTSKLPLLLPALLAALDDPAPAVQRLGQVALTHLAGGAAPSELQWQRPLLMDTASRMLAGCDPVLWPSAFPAACALALALDAGDGRAPASVAVFSAMLAELERAPDDDARQAVFLSAAVQLLPVMGMQVLRFTTRLLPLLLQWAGSQRAETAVAAMGVLAVVVCHTWPRVPAHSGELQRRLGPLAEGHWAGGAAAAAGGAGTEVQRAAQGVLALVQQCCGNGDDGGVVGDCALGPGAVGVLD